MTFWRLWLILLSADWAARVVIGFLVAGGLPLSPETWLALLVVPPLQAAALLAALRVVRGQAAKRAGGPGGPPDPLGRTVS